MGGKGQKGCSHKRKCDCTLGGDACLKRLEGNGPASMKECHPPKQVLNQALTIYKSRQRTPDNRGAVIQIRWSTHRMS